MPATRVIGTKKKSNAKIAYITTRLNVMNPVHSSHSYMSRYGAWPWKRRVLTLYRTIVATTQNSEATVIGQYRSWKLNGLNGWNRYSQGSRCTVVDSCFAGPAGRSGTLREAGGGSSMPRTAGYTPGRS